MTATYQSNGAASAAYGQEIALKDFVALLKPRVMSLVVFTGVVGMVLAPGTLHPVLAIVAILCIAVGAGAAGAINMWYDRDIDALMSRTKNRPIPAGRVPPGAALGFGITLAVASVAIMALAVNGVAAGLLAFTIFFYVVIYSMALKRRTPQNIVIGGAAGAFPPMIGWAAVGGDIALASIVLFAIIFLWTPPHFWALALYKKGDYDKAGVPMLPVVAGRETTAWQMFVYTAALLPVTLLPCIIGLSGMVYGAGALVLGVLFLACAVNVIRDKSDRSARRMFPFSILYLFLIFVLLLVDQSLWIAV
ncbi:MAG: protoheme IX farnesyltransferase [Rhodospirillaceae bacterium]|nr:protoheme IX farnesyltransferase [Rhodospirillaceae bacterium]MBT5674300.1 protoheme IX farnesyltransferase [Rhodospirillaceae bacterium]MBT5778393.1 protoheme IX farnesyltransferase [Rhodospirillaceae bacterium]MBT6831142.1 protoheme IX farnesyltransferase [Rhodospirillaceae bacterium]MBT7294122.1 protoheme IX farnesyltransferase [Rhodospirillaceae bacterium]